IPVLEGTATGLAALGHLLRDSAFRAQPALAAPDPAAAEVREHWRAVLPSGEPMTEAMALGMIADYGVPTVQVRSVASFDEAVEAADAVGYPVAMKTAMPGVSHKSDVDGVRLGLVNADE